MSPSDIAELYRIAMKQTDGNKEQARLLVEAYLAGQSKLLPRKNK